MSLSLDRINISHKGEDDIQSIDNNFQAIENEINSHLAENANKHIAESGSNANGSYIKFDDGTMICWGIKTYNPLDINTASGNIYVRTVPGTTYPATFIEVPSTSFSAKTRTRVPIIVNLAENAYTTHSGTIHVAAFAVYNSDIALYWQAFGRWK